MNTAIAEAHDLGWKLAWVLRGWAGPALLDTYQAEWRPVGACRAARSAQQGSELQGVEALAEDLDGRLPHAWLRRGHRRVSTLDQLGPGLTLLTGPDGRAWADAAAAMGTAFPLDVHAVDGPAAGALGIGPDGAVLVRPDARVVARWAAAGGPPPDLTAAVGRSRWLAGEPATAGPRRLTGGPTADGGPRPLIAAAGADGRRPQKVASWRSRSRQRPLVGPMLPTGMSMATATCW